MKECYSSQNISGTTNGSFLNTSINCDHIIKWSFLGFPTVKLLCFPLELTGELLGDELRLCKNILLLIKLPPTHVIIRDGFSNSIIPSLYQLTLSRKEELSLCPHLLHFLTSSTTRWSSLILYFSKLYFNLATTDGSPPTRSSTSTHSTHISPPKPNNSR